MKVSLFSFCLHEKGGKNATLKLFSLFKEFKAGHGRVVKTKYTVKMQFVRTVPRIKMLYIGTVPTTKIQPIMTV